MMKRMLMLVLPLVAALMFGCQNTPFSLDEGRYIPEQSEKDDMAVPYLLIGEDNRIEVIQDILVCALMRHPGRFQSLFPNFSLPASAAFSNLTL